MAKFEIVPLGELKIRIPRKLLPLVEEYKAHFGKLRGDQGGRLVLEKGDDAKELRRVLQVAAGALNRRIRFPLRGEEGSLSFYLEAGGRRGRRRKGEATPAQAGSRKRGRRGAPRADREA